MNQIEPYSVSADRAMVSDRPARPERPLPTLDRVLALITAILCAGLLLYKFLLSTRLNVNWDEFYFLSHVYSLLRGELNFVLLGAYTHLFTWLPLVDGDEIRQIVVARWVMLGLLALTCWFIFQLSRRWLTGVATVIPCFVYLSAMPVVLHGGSFRYDSMLAPLSMAALLLLVQPSRPAWRDYAAGAVSGIAFAITVKVALFAPLYLATIAFREAGASGTATQRIQTTAAAAFRVAITGIGVAAALLFMHSMSVTPAATDTLTSDAGAAARKTLLETPWFPRIAFLEAYVRWQALHWLLIALGTVIALARRNLLIASLALALFPVAFYRNAFPYYYVVMLAPAAVLAGYAVQELMATVRPKTSGWVASALLATIWVGTLYQGTAKIDRLFVDDQVIQQSLLDGIHEIFPEPVNYVDRCAMVPSFRKVNFFMSTWGMDNYLMRSEPFMPAVIREHKPAFILENAAALNPGRADRRAALAEDRILIADFYPTYWGPVRVAGASKAIDAGKPVTLRVPFPERYRIRSNGSLVIDGVPRRDGEVISVPASGVTVEGSPTDQGPAATSVALFLAAAGPPPERDLPPWPLFSGL
jgi:hypothetical protein